MHVCYTSHLGVQFDSGVPRDSRYVMVRFQSMDCSMAFSKCGPAIHSIYVLGLHLK